MVEKQFLLVADDRQLHAALQDGLPKALARLARPCGFAAARDRLPDLEGLAVFGLARPADFARALPLLREVRCRQAPPALLVVQGEALPRAEGVRLGAYLPQRLRWPQDARRLAGLVQRAVGPASRARPARPETPADVLSRRLRARTPALLPLAGSLALAAGHDVPLLLTGETGTGKTYLARFLHEHSPRRAEPFLLVPCGAMPATLVAGTFFGHVRGAFTGADRDREGKFAAAGAGTLLLDEIDALGLEHQACLLRVLETGEFEPVGGTATQRCRARIIAASNRDLEEAVVRGDFRADLYHRLNVLALHLPPLRERVADITALARHLTAGFAAKFGKDLFDLHPQTLAALEASPWPGNLRELENVLQQAVLLSSGPELLPGHLPLSVRGNAPVATRRCVGGRR
jgi:DNA-binding NtrC family response regulator